MFSFGLAFGLIGVVALFVTLRRSKGPARLRVGFRPDGHIHSKIEGGIGLTFDKVPVDSVSAMLIGVVNAGGSRINEGSTEEPVLIKLAPDEARFLAVDAGMAKLIDDQTLMLEIEQMHAGDRREVRVQYDGAEKPIVEVSGKIKDLARPIERYTGSGWPVGLAIPLFLMMVLTGLLVLGTSTGWGPFGYSRLSAIDIPEELLDDVGELVDADLSDFRSPTVTETSRLSESLPFLLPLIAVTGFALWAVATDYVGVRSFSNWVGLTRPTPFITVEPKDF